MGTPGLFIVAVIGLFAGAIGRAALATILGYPVTALWQIGLAALTGAVVLLPVSLLLRRR